MISPLMMCLERPSGGGFSIDKEIGNTYNISLIDILKGGHYGISHFGLAHAVPHDGV